MIKRKKNTCIDQEVNTYAIRLARKLNMLGFFFTVIADYLFKIYLKTKYESKLC